MTHRLAVLASRLQPLPYYRDPCPDADHRTVRRAAARAAQARFHPMLRHWVGPMAHVFGWLVMTTFEGAAKRTAPPRPGLPSAPTSPNRLRLMRAALRHRTSLAQVEAYGLASGDAGLRTAPWLFTEDTLILLPRLADPSVRALCRDKDAFAAYLSTTPLRGPRSHGTAPDGDTLGPLLAALEDGAVAIIKPRVASNGRGIIRVRRVGSDLSVDDGRGTPTPRPIAAWLAEAADLLAFPVRLEDAVRPHASLRVAPGPAADGARGADPADPATLAPPVLRLITGAPQQGGASVLGASLQRPAPGRVVTQGGPMRCVDCATGRTVPDRADHPLDAMSQDPALAGVVIPEWQSLTAAVCAAHDALPGQAPLIGWDIIPSDNGPVVLEANLSMSFFSVQAALGQPMGGGRASAILASYL